MSVAVAIPSPSRTALASTSAPYSLPRNDHGVGTRSEALMSPVSATTITHHSAIVLKRGSAVVFCVVTAMTRMVARPPTHSDTATTWIAMLMDAAMCECPACEMAAGAAHPNATTTTVAIAPERPRHATNRTIESRIASACSENAQPMAPLVRVDRIPVATSARPCARTSARVSRYCTHSRASHRPDHAMAHARARSHVVMRSPTTTSPMTSIDATSRA